MQSAGDTIRVASRNYYDVEIDKKLALGGNYGTDTGDLHDCNDGNIVGNYRFNDGGPLVVVLKMVAVP